MRIVTTKNDSNHNFCMSAGFFGQRKFKTQSFSQVIKCLLFQILPNIHMGVNSMQRYGISKRADNFEDLENVWKDLGFQVGYA